MTDDTPQKRDMKEAPSSRELATNRTDDPKYYPPHQSADYTKIMARMQSTNRSEKQRLWGVITKIVAAVLGVLGIAANPDFMADGIQLLGDLPQIVPFVIACIGWIVEALGHNGRVKETA